jgi:hypothetical protein
MPRADYELGKEVAEMSNPKTETAEAGVVNGVRRLQRRKRASVKLNREAFQFVEDEEFHSDYDLIAAVVDEYNGRPISSYKRDKTRDVAGVSVVYATARFPQADKNAIMKKLRSCLDLETFITGTKVAGYYVKSVNHEVVNHLIEKEAYFSGR